MPKKPDKPFKNSEPSPTERQNVILEEMQDQFRHFGEGLTDVQEKVAKIPQILGRMENLENDMATVKAAIPMLATKKDIEAFSRRLTTMESR